MPFNRILNKIAGDYNQKQLNACAPIVRQINGYVEAWKELSDSAIQSKTTEFKERLAQGATLDSLLPEAFATVKEACRRMLGQELPVKDSTEVWNMVPYDVQLVGGIILHQGNIAEMRTGEGKTLVATLPAYLNALTGKGVHIVTVNDYLASRDAEWMGHLYRWLGLTVGSVTKSTSLDQRRTAYEQDITYVENSELGFDYLRDNLAKSNTDRSLVWRPLNYAIVDEVDSILIDEARTPLIISQPSEEPTEKYVYYAKIVQMLTAAKGKKKVSKGFLSELLKEDLPTTEDEDTSGDYHIDEKTKTATLTSEGIAKLEQLLKVDNLYRDLGYQEIHHIENALKAQAVYHKDKEYLIREGEILLVDEHTGRVMPGRRFSQGLHQAIEAKEGVQVQRESKTLATITYQHFFKQYVKLAGMTGTAMTEAEEFEKIYELETFSIPTNNPIIRVDKNDQVYFNQHAKWKAVVDYISFYHRIGVPLLIGTSSIQTSEYVSGILNKMTFPHYVLNAKFHESEANIVKHAGKLSSLVVATNMAGRGTDIKLDPALMGQLATNYVEAIASLVRAGKGMQAVVYSEREYEATIGALQKKWDITDEQIRQAERDRVHTPQVSCKITFNKSKKKNEDGYVQLVVTPAQKTTVDLEQRDFHYGLFILGTEKHESRRIDNQLRGRAGRQGDPGVSIFFVALDDEIMRKMGGERIQSIAKMMLSKEELEQTAFTQKQFTNSIIRAQKQMEGRHFGTRKHLFDYDSVINKQRTRIYAKRDEILQKDAGSEVVTLSMRDEIVSFIPELVEKIVDMHPFGATEERLATLDELAQLTGAAFVPSDYEGITSERVWKDRLIADCKALLDAKCAGIPEENIEPVLRRVYLSIIDRYWMEHIDQMQSLREKVALYGYAQLDPLVIYKKESFTMFQQLLLMIKQETYGTVMRLDVARRQQPTIQVGPSFNPNMMQILQQVAGSVPTQTPKQTPKQAQHAQAFATPSTSSDGVEVLEIKDAPVVKHTTKIKPNDKVTIKYADGRIVSDVKFKKVKEDIESGKAVVVL